MQIDGTSLSSVLPLPTVPLRRLGLISRAGPRLPPWAKPVQAMHTTANGAATALSSTHDAGFVLSGLPNGRAVIGQHCHVVVRPLLLSVMAAATSADAAIAPGSVVATDATKVTWTRADGTEVPGYVFGTSESLPRDCLPLR
jgi:hypothetical protein